MTTIRVKVDTRARVAEVSFRFDPAVVEAIKLMPAGARSWDAARKVWTVTLAQLGELTEILEADGHRLVFPRGNGTGAPPPRSAPSENWADALMTAVGPARVEPVHRALSRVLHPDTSTGDNVLMRELNAARDRSALR